MKFVFTTIYRRNKGHDKSDPMNFLPMNISESSTTSTNVELSRRTLRREAKKVDMMLDNNRKFDWKVLLVIIIQPDDRL